MSTKFLAPIYRFVSEWKNLNFTKCPKNLQPINLTWLWGSPLGQNFHAVRATPSISQSRIRLIRCFNYYFNPPPPLFSHQWSGLARSLRLLKIDSHCVILNYLTQAPPARWCCVNYWMWNQFSILLFLRVFPSIHPSCWLYSYEGDRIRNVNV